MMAFVGCTTIALLGLLVHVPAVPMLVASDWALLVLYAFIWLIGGTLLSTYGVTHVQASRAAIMQVLELIVAMVSAVLLGGESLSLGEIIGALMILCATMIEALSTQPSEATQRLE